MGWSPDRSTSRTRECVTCKLARLTDAWAGRETAHNCRRETAHNCRRETAHNGRLQLTESRNVIQVDQTLLPRQRLNSLPKKTLAKKNNTMCPSFVKGMAININSPASMWRVIIIL